MVQAQKDEQAGTPESPQYALYIHPALVGPCSTIDQIVAEIHSSNQFLPAIV